MGGWVAGSNENITNSAPNWVGLGVGAELGKNDFFTRCTVLGLDKKMFRCHKGVDEGEKKEDLHNLAFGELRLQIF